MVEERELPGWAKDISSHLEEKKKALEDFISKSFVWDVTERRDAEGYGVKCESFFSDPGRSDLESIKFDIGVHGVIKCVSGNYS